MAECPLTIDAITNKVLEFENSKHEYHNYKNYVQNIFLNHYNDEHYMNVIKEKLIELQIL